MRKISRALVAKQIVDAAEPKSRLRPGLAELGVGGGVVLLEIGPQSMNT
jgi:hypothetical protein